MRFNAATHIFFATLALTSPAPIVQPEQTATKSLARPLADILASRADAPALAPEVDARASSGQLEERKSKLEGSKGGNNTSAAGMMSPCRALELGALGLSVMEIARLWA